MHERTIATLQQLEMADWFINVGIEDTKTALVLSSWHAAVEHCSSAEWENLCMEAANQYRERLLEKSEERFSKWNEIVDEIKPITEMLVKRRIDAIVEMHNLPVVFEQTVQWDMLHVCMEAEFADVYQPGFYASLAYWYTKGHFPCGWEGEFPKGRIIVF